MTARPHVQLGDTCAAIVAAPAPVLMVDTCTLLDIVRAPRRRSSDPLEPAQTLLTLATQTPKALHVVLSYTVVEEWGRHFDETVEEMRDHVRDLRESLKFLGEACIRLGRTPPPELEVSFDAVVDRLADLAKHVFDSGFVIARDEECRRRAATRSQLGEPPARQAKSSAGDCLILEHFLALCRELRSAGMTIPCVFVSSNTVDYCSLGHLHRELQDEFQPLDLEYARNLWEARRRLGF